MIVRSPFDDLDIPDVGLPQFLFSDLSDHADSVAVIDGPSGAQMTFGELAHGVDRFAAALGERAGLLGGLGHRALDRRSPVRRRGGGTEESSCTDHRWGNPFREPLPFGPLSGDGSHARQRVGAAAGGCTGRAALGLGHWLVGR